MENKMCKKCHKPLPNGYKYNECEFCRSKPIQKIKNSVKAVFSVGAVAALIAVTIKGKNNLKK